MDHGTDRGWARSWWYKGGQRARVVGAAVIGFAAFLGAIVTIINFFSGGTPVLTVASARPTGAVDDYGTTHYQIGMTVRNDGDGDAKDCIAEIEFAPGWSNISANNVNLRPGQSQQKFVFSEEEGNYQIGEAARLILKCSGDVTSNEVSIVLDNGTLVNQDD